MNEQILEQMALFFEDSASPEHVAQSLLKVLGRIDCSKFPGLKNDRDMLVTFLQCLL